jgi:luciferase family oxidoreductase group 1
MAFDPLPDAVVDAQLARQPLLRLGTLDLCPTPPGGTGRDALFDSLEQAVRVEELGYSRYWLAEHHGPGTSHSSPEVLASLIAQLTRHIRVGTAGVLLNYYSPLKVAKDFRLLQALFPGRIDLGVGAGRVDDETARRLLDRPASAGASQMSYAEKVGDLAAYLGDDKLAITPRGVGAPAMWVLGSGGSGSAQLAARHGAAYSLSLFLAGGSDDPAVVAAYRDRFEPSRLRARPAWNIAVAGICAETEEEARRLAALHRNPALVLNVIGSPQQCRTRLLDIAARYQTDEIIFLALCAGLEQRLRCYRLLAQALGLPST